MYYTVKLKQAFITQTTSQYHSLSQMLVYENYNKFIAATDTIKLMSASMEGMDDRMASLRTLIGVCCGCWCWSAACSWHVWGSFN